MICYEKSGPLERPTDLKPHKHHYENLEHGSQQQSRDSNFGYCPQSQGKKPECFGDRICLRIRNEKGKLEDPFFWTH
jgi:hypothetical protein